MYTYFSHKNWTITSIPYRCVYTRPRLFLKSMSRHFDNVYTTPPMHSRMPVLSNANAVIEINLKERGRISVNITPDCFGKFYINVHIKSV